MTLRLLILIGNIVLIAAAVEAVTFIALYQRLSRGAWRRDPIGRQLMAFGSVDAAVFGLAAIRIVGGASLDTGWFAWLRLATLVGIPWVLGWRILILVKINREGRS